MKCPHCGKDNPASEQYCLDCGGDLAAAPVAGAQPHGAGVATPAAAPAGGSLAMSDEEFQRLLNTPPPATKCPHCGAAAPADGTFCDNCGEPLKAETAPAAAQPATTPPPSVQPTAQPAGANPHAAAQTPPVAAATTPPAASAPTDAAPGATLPIGASPAAPSGSQIAFDLSGPATSSRVTMAGDELKIGRRDAEAGIYPEIDFDGNDIVVEGNDRVHAVSRRHGRIFREGDALRFEDLGSTNGSTLNGAPVLARDPQPLKDGDTIVLGRTCRITVHLG